MVAGIACFTVPPSVWQARILTDVFHDRCLGNGVCKAVPITQHLEKARMIRSPFLRVPGMVADDAAMIEPDFAPPWQAVDAYLKHLASAASLVQHGYSMVLARQICRTVESACACQETEDRRHPGGRAGGRLDIAELPEDERGDVTGESWLDSIHAASGTTYRAALQSDIEAPKISGEIDAIVDMLEKHGPLPYGTVGLPIEGAIDRHKVRMAKRTEEQREKQIQEANRLRQSRCDRLCVDAEQALPDAEVGVFLTTKRDDLNGLTPLEAAEESESGLSRARDRLSDLERQRAREAEAAAERKLYQEKIRDEAKRRLAGEHSYVFLNARADDLGRMTPLAFVKDESTYRKALGKLSEWEREFGR
jgi:hypothetical protein